MRWNTLELALDGRTVVVVGEDLPDDLVTMSGASTAPQLPAGMPAFSWCITADGAWCEGERPPGWRSILVGPRRPPAHRPTLRCDIEARDLPAPAMAILVRETMASR